MGIPVLGAVRAGEPSEAQQRVIGCLPLPREIAGGGYFALRVKGDSMINEGICEGDLVLIRRQSHVDFNGQIICALVNGENTLKIFVVEKEKVLLRAANRSYPDIVLKNERELTIQGVYAGVFKFPAGQKPCLFT
jgi:repressor LexA